MPESAVQGGSAHDQLDPFRHLYFSHELDDGGQGEEWREVDDTVLALLDIPVLDRSSYGYDLIYFLSSNELCADSDINFLGRKWHSTSL